MYELVVVGRETWLEPGYTTVHYNPVFPKARNWQYQDPA